MADGTEHFTHRLTWLEQTAKAKNLIAPQDRNEHYWYGSSADDKDTTEALVKFEYASPGVAPSVLPWPACRLD